MYIHTAFASSARTLPWSSLSYQTDDTGYIVYESKARFGRERLTEGVLRIVGALLILGGYVQWFIPEALLAGDPILTRTFLSLAFMAVGWAMYIFASRGFRRMLRFDTKSRVLELARLDSKDRLKGREFIGLARIDSMFIRRGEGCQTHSALFIREKGTRRVLVGLRGRLDELEMLHDALCRDVRMAREIAAKQPKRTSEPLGVPGLRRPVRVPRFAGAIPAE